MLSKKRMRNIIIDKIDKILMKYYKEIDFEKIGEDASSGEEANEKANITNVYRDQAMELIDLMKELELINADEHHVLRDVYGDYFGLHEAF